jgi:hypothetical protein
MMIVSLISDVIAVGPMMGAPWESLALGAMTRFGVQLPNFSGFDPADLFDHIVSLAAVAEDAGFDAVWVMDHFYQLPPLGGPDQPMLEAYTLLGALAARTQRARHAGDGRDLSQPRHPGEDRDDAGHHLAGPGHSRHRRRLVRR